MDNDRTNYFLNAGSLFLAVLLIITGLSYSKEGNFAPIVEASAATHNVSGFAWSGGADGSGGTGVHWISFNCEDSTGEAIAPFTNDCSNNYGVNIDAGGNFSGYAWSDEVGWINFAPSAGATGCTTEPCNTFVNLAATDDTPVTGWARACAVFQTGCSGALKSDSELGGWDGWISMHCSNPVSGFPSGVCGTSNYGVYLEKTPADPDLGHLKGYAWGDKVFGWINFDPLYGGVVLSGPDVKVNTVNNPVTAENSMTINYGDPLYVFWNVADTTGCDAVGGLSGDGWADTVITNSGSIQVTSPVISTNYSIIDCIGGTDIANVTVLAPFTLEALTDCEPNPMDLNVSNECTALIRVTPAAGFSDIVTLSVPNSQVPGGTGSFAPASLDFTTDSNPQNTTLTFTVPLSFKTGGYRNITVRGTSGATQSEDTTRVRVTNFFKAQTKVEEI